MKNMLKFFIIILITILIIGAIIGTFAIDIDRHFGLWIVCLIIDISFVIAVIILWKSNKAKEKNSTTRELENLENDKVKIEEVNNTLAEIEKNILKAKEYYTKGNFEKVEFNLKREYFRISMEAAQEVLKISSNNDDLLIANNLIQANAFFLGDFKTSLTACDNAIKLNRHSRDAIIMLVNVWTQIKNAAYYMLEKREKEYQVTYLGGALLTKLKIQQVIDLLAMLKNMEDVYSIRPEVEDLLTKLVALELAFLDESNELLQRQ